MSLVWLDGEVRYTTFTSFDLRDRGLTLGDGLFETVLVVNRTALWLQQHLDRMEASARALGIVFIRARAEQATVALLEKVDASPHVLRLTCTRGIAARGLAGEGAAPTVFAVIEPFDAAAIGEPARLRTGTVRRHSSSPSAAHKTLSYVDNIVAAREAAQNDADDALLLNGEGNVACSTIANVFLVQGGRLVTPALDQAILPGITRAVVLGLAGSLGFVAEERAVAPIEFRAADAVFLTNSLRLVRPVTTLDGEELGTGDVTPILAALLKAIEGQCGVRLPLP